MDVQRRDPPVETIAELRPPHADYPYFAQGDTFPFRARLDPGDELGTAINASWLADACFLVYGEPDFVTARVAPTPFQLDWIGTAESNQGMVLANEHALILVFRGTRLQVRSVLERVEVTTINQDDLRVDARFLPRVCRAGGKVHGGFLDAFDAVCPTLDEILARRPPDQALWLTGHSLGGALATLAAAHAGPENVEGLFTYGCPRVGDLAFAEALPSRNYLRFVHRDDWVTTVPPAQVLGYAHAGSLVTLTGSGERNLIEDVTTGAQEFLKALRGMVRDLPFRIDEFPFKIGGLADHAPIYYATLLWNALLERSGR